MVKLLSRSAVGQDRSLPRRSLPAVGCDLLLLFLEDVPHRPGKNHGLHVRWHPAGIEHGVIARLALIEFSQFPAESIRTENKLLECIGAAGWSMRTDHSAPPEDRTEESVVIALLDQSGSGNIEV